MSERNAFRLIWTRPSHFCGEVERHDFWSQLETLVEHEDDDILVVHLVQSGRNLAWNQHPSSVAQLQTLVGERPGRVLHHVLPNAGHWVHSDDLPGLLRAMESVVDW
jgi:hypothetical protein